MSTNGTLNQTGHFVNGACSSFFMLTLMQPVFTLKTYVMSGKGLPPLTAAYKGFGANCIGVVPIQAVAFATQGAGMRVLSDNGKKELSNGEKTAINLAASIAPAPLAAAFERVMILQQVNARQESFAVTCQALVAKEGYQGFLKGLKATIGRDFLFLQALFSGSDSVKKELEPLIEDKQTRDVAGDATAGAIAGVASTPLDLIKTRMQAGGSDCAAVFPTARKVIQEGGAAALFRGSPVRAGLVGGAMVLIGQAKEHIPALFPSMLHETS